MIWIYEAEQNGHLFKLKGRLDNKEAWKSLQQQMLLLLDPEPKALPKSEPLPCCRSIMSIRTTEISM